MDTLSPEDKDIFSRYAASIHMPPSSLLRHAAQAVVDHVKEHGDVSFPLRLSHVLPSPLCAQCAVAKVSLLQPEPAPPAAIMGGTSNIRQGPWGA